MNELEKFRRRQVSCAKCNQQDQIACRDDGLSLVIHCTRCDPNGLKITYAKVPSVSELRKDN
jgi:hypothetical protein